MPCAARLFPTSPTLSFPSKDRDNNAISHINPQYYIPLAAHFASKRLLPASEVSIEFLALALYSVNAARLHAGAVADADAADA